VDNFSVPSPCSPHKRTKGQEPLLHADEDGSPVTGGIPPAVQQPPVLAKVKQHILQGEFVDFDILLPEALYPTKQPLPIFLIVPVHGQCRGGHGNRVAQARTSPGWRPEILILLSS
jgi:hypothetical protein